LTQTATTVGENGSNDVRIPVSLNFAQIGQGVVQLLQGNRSVQYSLDGSLDLGTTLPLLGDVTLPLDRTGQLTISR
jgi:hypothetical protein